jgi:hypothetical protein
MRYWLTTQWPRTHNDPNEPRKDVWVQDGKFEVMRPMTPGDKVFVYEFVTGPTIYCTDTEGIRYSNPGQGGIISLLKITSEPEETPFQGEYTDGRSMWWRHKACAEYLDLDGFVPCSSVTQVLGYSKGYRFRGFGQQRSGLKQISRPEFDGLFVEFKKHKPRFGT